MRTYLLVGSSLLAASLTTFAAGLNNGTSWADAWTNMASVVWTRGDTYYIAGGTYEPFSVTLSGTNWVTIKKANEADNGGDAGWDASYATNTALITGASTSYIVRFLSGGFILDGVTGTNNSGHGIKVQNTYDDDTNEPGPLIYLGAGTSPFQFRHLELAGTGYGTQYHGGDGLYQNNISPTAKNLYIGYCYIHGVDKNGVTLGGLVGTSFDDYGLLWEHNWLEDTGGSYGPGWHGQGVQLSYNNSDRYTIWRHSVWKNITGTGSLVFMDGASDHRDALLYNNVFYRTDGANRINSPGVICGWQGVFSNIVIIHSTFRGITNCTDVRLYGGGETNNVLANFLFERFNFAGGHVGVNQTNNGYYLNYGSVPSGTPGQVNGAASAFISPTTYDFRAVAGGYAVNAGVDWSSVLTNDYRNFLRDAYPDIGAYESSGLVGYWALDENTGTNAADGSGLGLTGELQSPASWSANARIGSGSVYLNGTGAGVHLAYSPLWTWNENFTVSAWVWSTATARAVAFGRWTITLGNGVSLEQIDATRFDMEFQDREVDEDAHRSLGTGLFTTNTWQHVLGMRTNDVVRIFVNGVAGSTSAPMTNDITLGTALGVLGNNRPSASDYPWTGYVDDVKLYNRALTSDEIALLAAGGDIEGLGGGETGEPPEPPPTPVPTLQTTTLQIGTLRKM